MTIPVNVRVRSFLYGRGLFFEHPVVDAVDFTKIVKFMRPDARGK